MLELIGIVVVAYVAWKILSAVISGGARGHMMRSLDYAMSLGVPYDFAYRMILNRKIMKDCRAHMMGIMKDFGAKDVYVQNGEILQILYEGYLLEQEKSEVQNGQLRPAFQPDPAEEIIPREHRDHIKLSDILERAEAFGVPREESLLILRNQREKIEHLMSELDQLQGGVVTTGEMGLYGWLEPNFFWGRNIVRVIESIYGERFEDRSGDWGTDEGIRFLIQRAAKNPDSMHIYPNLKYDTVCQFVDKCESTCEWFEGFGGVQFWCDVGNQTYHTIIRTLVPELKDDSGVKIWAKIEAWDEIEKI